MNVWELIRDGLAAVPVSVWMALGLIILCIILWRRFWSWFEQRRADEIQQTIDKRSIFSRKTDSSIDRIARQFKPVCPQYARTFKTYNQVTRIDQIDSTDRVVFFDYTYEYVSNDGEGSSKTEVWDSAIISPLSQPWPVFYLYPRGSKVFEKIFPTSAKPSYSSQQYHLRIKPGESIPKRFMDELIALLEAEPEGVVIESNGNSILIKPTQKRVALSLIESRMEPQLIDGWIDYAEKILRLGMAHFDQNAGPKKTPSLEQVPVLRVPSKLSTNQTEITDVAFDDVVIEDVEIVARGPATKAPQPPRKS